MEHLFSPCTRFFNLSFWSDDNHGEHFWDDFERLEEQDLDVSTQEFLSAERAFTYADLYAMLANQNTVLWLTPHASVVSEYGLGVRCSYHLGGDNRFIVNVNGKEINVLARSSAALLEIVDIVRRLLVANASEIYKLELENEVESGEVFFNAPGFASLMEHCQNLKVLTLGNMTSLNEDQIRVLGAFSRPGLEIELQRCRIFGAAAEALAEVLGSNQGPTKLLHCHIDYSVLANGFRGNSRLKSFSPDFSLDFDVGNQEVLAIARALPENRGLVNLNLLNCVLSDETWGTVCDSLKTHPTLQVLNLQGIRAHGGPPFSPAGLKTRIQALVDMLKVNMSIQTIPLGDYYYEHELFRRSVIPYLKTNKFRPRVRAIQKTRPIAYRTKVLGRALLAVRTDPTRLWMLLSENAEVAFASTTATTTPAANLPTPATVDASANASTSANAATVAANPVDTGPPTVNDAASASGQKRKACPQSQPGIAN
jgi:hypothetical protein